MGLIYFNNHEKIKVKTQVVAILIFFAVACYLVSRTATNYQLPTTNYQHWLSLLMFQLPQVVALAVPTAQVAATCSPSLLLHAAPRCCLVQLVFLKILVLNILKLYFFSFLDPLIFSHFFLKPKQSI